MQEREERKAKREEFALLETVQKSRDKKEKSTQLFQDRIIELELEQIPRITNPTPCNAGIKTKQDLLRVSQVFPNFPTMIPHTSVSTQVCTITQMLHVKYF